MKNFLKSFLGVFLAILLAINMLFAVFMIMLISLISYLAPSPQLRTKIQTFLQKIPVFWMDINFWITQILNHGKWQVEKDNAPLNPQGWYILISNHQSWVDIFILGMYFRHKIPNLKFFMKKELLWTLPFASWACYLLDYPFMGRHSHADVRKNPELKTYDIEATKKACDKFKEFPTTVMNFVEGTRFTTQKQQTQQSPYQNLLKPKSMGIGLVLHELHPYLKGVINVTLYYQPRFISLWAFISGKVEKIYLHYDILPISPDIIGDPYTDRVFRKQLQQWLNSLWLEKDQRLKTL